MRDHSDPESPVAQLRRGGLIVLTLLTIFGSLSFGVFRLADLSPTTPSFASTTVAASTPTGVTLKPPIPSAKPSAVVPTATTAAPKAPAPAPKGMPPSGPKVCKSSKDGGRCFNFQLKQGACHWSNAKYPQNIKLAWKINQAPGGFGAKYWNSWCKLGMAESGWRHNALGPYVDILAEDGKPRGRACGIMQALPCRKVRGGIKLSPEGQIVWMRNYIRERYGNPDKAWQHEITHQWY